MSTGISLSHPSFDPSRCHVRKSSNVFVTEGQATTHMLCFRPLWRQESDIRTEDCPTSNSSSASASQHHNNQYNHLLQSQSAQHFFIHQFQSTPRSNNQSINQYAIQARCCYCRLFGSLWRSRSTNRSERHSKPLH